MIHSINFPVAQSCIAPYGDWDKLEKRIKALGLDGVEAIWDPDEIDDRFPARLMTGCHMLFYPDWLDFYRRNEPELLRKFGSWEMVETIYRGRDTAQFVEQFRFDLERAVGLGAKYLVYHVSDVSLEESYTYRWLHDDYAVLDGAIEMINELLKGVEPTFDFLVENQWWPGFTFTDPAKTEYLLSRINYPRVGIMLDTGHLMNSDTSIRSQADGVEYVLRRYREHGELGKAVLGMHFHQSVSGAYVRRNTGAVPEDFPTDYFAAFFRAYPHIESIDRHRPWTIPACARIVDEVAPKYLTHELSVSPKRPQLAATKRQMTAVKKGLALI